MTTSRQSPKQLSPRVIGTIVIAVLALIFVFQNTGRGQVQFLFWTVTAPAWAWLLMIFVAGLIVGSLFPWLRRRGSRG
ncbi:MAG: hypothetical protein K0R87_388 [Pseudonocardia sp.]|jgi:uncharacterized integral membrane protein|nr:hypothetical protein [Pseudonocardia sp.]